MNLKEKKEKHIKKYNRIIGAVLRKDGLYERINITTTMSSQWRWFSNCYYLLYYWNWII
jgi:hypothetical protein